MEEGCNPLVKPSASNKIVPKYMSVNYYSTLTEAQNDQDRYTHFLQWNVDSASNMRSGFQEAAKNLEIDYSIFTHNCDDVASDIIRAAGVSLDDKWIPNLTYLQESDDADRFGSWKELLSQ